MTLSQLSATDRPPAGLISCSCFTFKGQNSISRHFTTSNGVATGIVFWGCSSVYHANLYIMFEWVSETVLGKAQMIQCSQQDVCRSLVGRAFIGIVITGLQHIALRRYALWLGIFAYARQHRDAGDLLQISTLLLMCSSYWSSTE